MAYQSESVDSKVDSYKLNPSAANLKTSERKKTKEIYIKYNATNKNFVNAWSVFISVAFKRLDNSLTLLSRKDRMAILREAFCFATIENIWINKAQITG